MWFFVEREDEDGDFLYAWSNRKPYYGNRNCYRFNRKTNKWVYQSFDTWKVGCRHDSHHVHNVDLSEVRDRLFSSPMEFELVIDNENPQWWVERKADNLFIDDQLRTAIRCNSGEKFTYLNHYKRLMPSYLPEVKEEDGIVGVRIEIKEC